jgi:hypothetical protein
MAILKFRVYYEEDESIYRDILIKHKQSFFDFYTAILQSWEFDSKHQATFFRSNDKWQRGREISLDVYEKEYPVPPFIMKDTTIASEIRDTNQRFIFLYDFAKNWSFLVELINISKEENPRIIYPSVSRKEGIGPQQYGTRGLLGPKFAEMEEKYDLGAGAEGFTEEGDTDGIGSDESATAEELGIGGDDE